MENSDLVSGCHKRQLQQQDVLRTREGRQSWDSERPAQQAGVHSISRALTLQARSGQELECWCTDYVHHSHVCVYVCVYKLYQAYIQN